jgi:hypothetical protein
MKLLDDPNPVAKVVTPQHHRFLAMMGYDIHGSSGDTPQRRMLTLGWFGLGFASDVY